MHLIQKGDSNSKHFSFFVFYFNVSNKVSSNLPRLLNFQEFPNPTPLPFRLLSFEEFSNPPSIRHSRVLKEVNNSSEVSLMIQSSDFNWTKKY